MQQHSIMNPPLSVSLQQNAMYKFFCALSVSKEMKLNTSL